MKESSIGIAMSGGVDSTTTALLLRDHYNVQGFFMHLAQPNFETQRARVETLAIKLNIPLQVVDLRQPFRQKVLDYFSTSYFNGLTPNPCVICNKEIKFGLLLNTVMAAGMTRMATGHYARIVKKDDLFELHKGADPKKDQSYFLSRLKQEQLAKLIFPLGEKIKEDTYRLAEKCGFDDFQGLESQDVCFLEDNEIGSYLEPQAKKENSSGSIITISGKTLGKHKGIFRYTIGQRKGLGISSNAPLYVVGLDQESNSVIVGNDSDLFQQHIHVEDLHWLAGFSPDTSRTYTVRIRYSHRGSAAKLVCTDNGRGIIHFDEPQRAITPGQFAVLYDDTELLGSGVIMKDRPER